MRTLRKKVSGPKGGVENDIYASRELGSHERVRCVVLYLMRTALLNECRAYPDTRSGRIAHS